MQKNPQDLRLQQYVSFASALKHNPSGAGAASSRGVSLHLLRALQVKSEECACTGEEELKQAGGGSTLPSQWKRTYTLPCTRQPRPDLWFT